MYKTDEVELNETDISKGLYKKLVKELNQTRDDVIFVNDIRIRAIIEHNEG